jgi:hypothetical protein
MLLAVVLFGFVFKLSSKEDNFKIITLTQSDFSMDQDAYNQTKNDGGRLVQLLTDKAVDFDNKNNFRIIQYHFTVNNNSPFDANEIELMISKLDNHSGIFIWKNNAVFVQTIKKFKSDTYLYDVLVKSQGLSDIELENAAKGVHFKLSTQMDIIGNKTQDVRSLS